MYRFQFPSLLLVLVKSRWTEKMWVVCGPKINISPTCSPQVPQILSMKCPPQQVPHIFPLNSQYFCQNSSYSPCKNQHFFEKPTYNQEWGNCWYGQNVDVKNLASDLRLAPIKGGEYVGNMLNWAECWENVDVGIYANFETTKLNEYPKFIIDKLL